MKEKGFDFDLGINFKNIIGAICFCMILSMLIPISTHAMSEVDDLNVIVNKSAKGGIAYRTATSSPKSIKFVKSKYNLYKSSNTTMLGLSDGYFPVLTGEPIIPRTMVVLGKISYRVGDAKIAQIEEVTNGSFSYTSLIGKSKGSTYLYATTADGKTARCLINVKEEYPTKIILNYTQKEVEIGKKVKFTALTVTSGNATELANYDVKYRVGNSKVASIDRTGILTGLNKGSTYVYASIANGMETKSLVRVVESKIALKRITMPKEQSIDIYDTANIKIALSPSNTDPEDITWSVGNRKIVDVDQKGNISAKQAGSTYVYAKGKNGITGKTLIKVIESTKITGLAIDSKQFIQVGKYANMNVKMTTVGSGEYKGQLIYSIGNPKIARINWKSNREVSLEGLSSGSTWLYVKAPNGLQTKSLITVSKFGVLKSINANSSYELSLNTGDDIARGVVNFIAENGYESSDFGGEAAYSVGNKNIASVENGIIIGKKVGSTYLTVSCQNKKAKILIKVVDNDITKINVHDRELVIDLQNGSFGQLNFTVDNLKGRISFTTGNSDIATVDQTGTVSAKYKNGSTYAYITLPDGKSEKILIKVINANEVLSINLPEKIDLNLNETNGIYKLDLGKYVKMSSNPNVPLESILTYTVGNVDVAVCNYGSIAATGIGKTKLTITAPNGVSASTIIDVHNY